MRLGGIADKDWALGTGGSGVILAQTPVCPTLISLFVYLALGLLSLSTTLLYIHDEIKYLQVNRSLLFRNYKVFHNSINFIDAFTRVVVNISATAVANVDRGHNFKCGGLEGIRAA